MTSRSIRKSIKAPLTICATLGALALASAGPAVADYTRQCNAEWKFTP